MKKMVLSIFLLTQIAFAQDGKKIQTYYHGYNGMELIAKSSKNVVIISTFNSKPTIREEIAQKVYSLFTKINCKTTLNIPSMAIKLMLLENALLKKETI